MNDPVLQTAGIPCKSQMYTQKYVEVGDLKASERVASLTHSEKVRCY